MTQVNRRGFIQGAAAAASAGMLQPGAALSSGPEIEASQKTVVETESGKVRSFVNQGVWIFRGIPYAEPTGGANRFLPPVN